MMDKHKNIFYFYKSPTRNSESTKSDQKQIEDNFTKALVNLLDPGNLGPIKRENREKCEKFLTEVVLSCLSEPPDLSSLGELQGVHLQKSTCGKTSEGTRRLDAIIEFESGLIGVESKVDSPIDPSQLRAEFDNLSSGGKRAFLILLAKTQTINNLKIDEIHSQIFFVSWEDIYESLKRYLKSCKSTTITDQFLAPQFKEYLELSGMVRQLTEWDFEKIQSGQSEALAGKLKSLLTEINTKMALPGFEHAPGGKKVPNEKVVWASLFEPELRKITKTTKLNQIPHFTADLSADGVTISLSIESRGPVRRLGEYLLKKRKTEFLEVIKNLEREGDVLLPAWETNEKSVFSIYFEDSKKHGRFGEEVLSRTLVPIYQKSTYSGTAPATKYHNNVPELRAECVAHILEEMYKIKKEDSSHYYWFRIRSHVPKKLIVDKNTLGSQADIIVEKSGPIFESYKMWREAFV